MSAVNPADWERRRTTGISGGPPRRSPHRPSLVQQLVDAAQADDLDAGGDGRSGEVRRWDDDAVDFQPVRGVCDEFGQVGVDGWDGAVLVHVAEDDGVLQLVRGWDSAVGGEYADGACEDA